MAKFTRADLKPGYIVVLRSGVLGMVMPCVHNDVVRLIIAYKSTCFRDGFDIVDFYKEDLTQKFDDSSVDIIEVYGYSCCVQETMQFSIRTRNLLWRRPETKKMTVKEFCKVLGYDVEIVKEAVSDA